MSFNLAHRVPVSVVIDGKPFAIQKFTRREFFAWAADRDAERVAAVTEGMDDSERARWLAFYQVAPTTFDDLFRLVFTPAGCEYVIRRCMEKSGATPEVIERVLDGLGPKQLKMLGLLLADLIDPEELVAPPAAKDEDKAGGDDPLTPPTNAASPP